MVHEQFETVDTTDLVPCKKRKKKKPQKKLPTALYPYLNEWMLTPPLMAHLCDQSYLNLSAAFARYLQHPTSENVKALPWRDMDVLQWQTFAHRVSNCVREQHDVRKPMLHRNDFEDNVFFYPVARGIRFLTSLLGRALLSTSSDTVGALSYGSGLTELCMLSEGLSILCVPAAARGPAWFESNARALHLWQIHGSPSVMYVEYRAGICDTDIALFVYTVKPKIVVVVGSFQMLLDCLALNVMLVGKAGGYTRHLFGLDLVATDFSDCDAYNQSTFAMVYTAPPVNARTLLEPFESHTLDSPTSALRYHIVRHVLNGDACMWWLDILNQDCPLSDILPHFKLRDCCVRLLDSFTFNTHCEDERQFELSLQLAETSHVERRAKELDPERAAAAQQSFQNLLNEEKKRAESVVIDITCDPVAKTQTRTMRSLVSGTVYTRTIPWKG